MKLTQKNFKQTINNNYIFENKPTIAIGVSGGPDSMALLFLLNQWIATVNGKLKALIVNHNLRNNSYDEALSVHKYLKDKKIDSKILNVKQNQIKKRSMHEARNNRYNLLTNFCKKNNILHLFMAHHKDDNIETFLTRKVSGSDFEGLDSIRSSSLINKININRPLLEFCKKDIIRYNLRHRILFVKDPSNYNLNYTRPTIRNFLEQTSKKNINEITSEFLTIKKNIVLYKKMIFQILIKNLIHINKNQISIDYKKFVILDPYISQKIIKIIFQFFNNQKAFLRSEKIQIFMKAIKNTKFKVFNLSGMIIKKSNESLIFFKKPN